MNTDRPQATPLSVSVVIPTRDRKAYLQEAIASVMRAADRAHEVCEIQLMVVDDGSTDGTLELQGAIPGTIVANHGRGLPAARNTGVERSGGELLAFLDDDDVWLEDHLLLHVEAHRRHPEAGVTYSQGRLADPALEPVTEAFPHGPLPSGWIQQYTSTASLQQANTLVVKRWAFDAISGFDESLIDNEDLDFVERMSASCQFAAIEEVTTLWRQHERPGPGSLAAWRDRYRRSRQVAQRSIERDGPLRASLPRRVRRLVRGRGWAALDASREAQRCLKHGRRGEAARLLAAAVWVSPPHAFARVPEFWPAVWGVVRGPRGGVDHGDGQQGSAPAGRTSGP